MGTSCAEGSARAAVATLCSNGGFCIILRLPGFAVSGSDAEQLGLGSPQYQDVPLGPAVWRKPGTKSELLLSAGAVDSLMSSQALTSADSLFQTAVGVVVSEVLYAIRQCEPLLVAGVPVAYRLSVQPPAWA